MQKFDPEEAFAANNGTPQTDVKADIPGRSGGRRIWPG
jgi:hypothetical protein